MEGEEEVFSYFVSPTDGLTEEDLKFPYPVVNEEDVKSEAVLQHTAEDKSPGEANVQLTSNKIRQRISSGMLAPMGLSTERVGRKWIDLLPDPEEAVVNKVKSIVNPNDY